MFHTTLGQNCSKKGINHYENLVTTWINQNCQRLHRGTFSKCECRAMNMCSKELTQGSICYLFHQEGNLRVQL